MNKNLVIVESPTKAKTISKFLGSDYKIESSFGHVRDLPKSKLGVDVEKNFDVDYEIPTRAKKKVTELKKLAKDAKMIYFATDEDREGEAISWHLQQIFKTPEEKSKRIVFHEITKEALNEALKNPRQIDKNLVDAQQARRVLDRIVGYKLSPFLWKKIARGLSAGRVQSVAVRLIVEKEREIEKFKPQEYWSIDAVFSNTTGTKQDFEAKLATIKDKAINKYHIQNEKEAKDIEAAVKNARFAATGVEKSKKKKSPLPPFTTSTLQQEANNRLGFSAKQTMMFAQHLYEGIKIGKEGQVGLITYMRTDSVNLSQKFLDESQNYIKKEIGEKYTTGIRTYKGKSKLAQEAHEAIRPTEANRDPQSIKEYLDEKQYKLYKLIWQRAIASQMSDALIDTTKIDIKALDTDYGFRANGSIINFDGYLKVYPTATKENILPELKEKDSLDLKDLKANQHFTQPPARYSEATLVKILEEHGIGRPSTYAPTIATIQERGYVEKIDRKLKPTDLAFLVNDLLVDHFPKVVDYKFTAKLEDDFDEIAEGKMKWQAMLKDFYSPFIANLKEKEESVKKEEVLSVHELGTDPKTKKPVYVRAGRFGPFVQLGSKDDEEKPKFASLRPGQTMKDVSLEEALHLLSLPRKFKEEDGKDVIVDNGRFGPYIKVGEKFISIKDEDPYTITQEKVDEYVAEWKKKEAEKYIKDFDGSNVQVLKGPYGAYITNGELNAKVPKDADPKKLTLKECEEILAKDGKKKGSGRRWNRKS